MAITKPHFNAETTAIANLKDDGYIIKPRGLSIVWGNDERYWKLPKANTAEPVELIQVSWLEVTGSVDLRPNRKYELSFHVELAPDAFGWRDIQVFLMSKVGRNGKYNWTRVTLGRDSTAGEFKIPDNTTGHTVQTSANPNADTTLHFGLYEVWSGKWKGGLKIHRAKVMPIN